MSWITSFLLATLTQTPLLKDDVPVPGGFGMNMHRPNDPVVPTSAMLDVRSLREALSENPTSWVTGPAMKTTLDMGILALNVSVVDTGNDERCQRQAKAVIETMQTVVQKLTTRSQRDALRDQYLIVIAQQTFFMSGGFSDLDLEKAKTLGVTEAQWNALSAAYETATLKLSDEEPKGEHLVQGTRALLDLRRAMRKILNADQLKEVDRATVDQLKTFIDQGN